MKPILLHYYWRLRCQTPLEIITVPKQCHKSQKPIMLHSNEKHNNSTIAAARVGVCLSGVPPLCKPHWHAQPHTNHNPWQDNASLHPLVHSYDPSLHWINCSIRNQKKRAPESREIPFLLLVTCLTQHMAVTIYAPTGTTQMVGT